MKSKIQLSAIFLLLIIGIFAPASYSQLPTYKMTLTNDSLLAPNVYEFDIYLLRTGSNIFQLFGFQIGILYDSTILNGGTLKASWVPGSNDTLLIRTNQVSTSIKTGKLGLIRIDPKVAVPYEKGAIISNIAPGNRIGRVRLTADKPFDPQKANFTWSFAPPWRTAVFAYDLTTHLNGNITDPENQIISFLNRGKSPPVLK
jgi:hypothetical protein